MLLGMKTLSRFRHRPKASPLSVVRFFGNVTSVRPVQLMKAISPISVSVSGKISSVSAAQSVNTQSPIFVSVFENVIDCRFTHFSKALLLITFTVSGIVMPFSPVQFPKILLGILSIPSSNVNAFNLLHFMNGL